MRDVINKTTTLILAGGKGTRIAAINPHLPKPMVLVAGQPFLEWVLRALLKQGFRHYVFSIGHLAHVVAEWVATRAASPLGETLLCHRELQAMGTGGAIRDALSTLTTEYSLVMNGDTLLLADFVTPLNRLQNEGLDGLIMGRQMDDTGRYGRLDVADGQLLRFSEKQPGKGLINGGIYLFRTAVLRENLPDGVSSLEVDVLPNWLEKGLKIGVAECAAPFIDIGTPETLTAADEFVARHRDYFV